jgi:hypothetical protein
VNLDGKSDMRGTPHIRGYSRIFINLSVNFADPQGTDERTKMQQSAALKVTSFPVDTFDGDSHRSEPTSAPSRWFQRCCSPATGLLREIRKVADNGSLTPYAQPRFALSEDCRTTGPMQGNTYVSSYRLRQSTDALHE